MEPLPRALAWITGILRSHDIPFVITGGLAAHAYGATRPLHDIDLDIPEDRFPEIVDEVRPYIIYGPDRYRDKVWDVTLMTLNYEGQDIDVGGAFTTRIMDEKTGIWHDCRDDLSTSKMMDVFGVAVPVVDREDLIEYKSWIALPGDHQEQDIREVRAAMRGSKPSAA